MFGIHINRYVKRKEFYMSYIKFLNSDEHLNGAIRVIDEHTIEVTGCNQNLSGLQWFTDRDRKSVV